MSITEPLRAEHRELRPDIDRLRTTAELVDQLPAAELVAQLDADLDFLRKHLIVHAGAEDAVLYPAVEQAMGAPGATATMRRDHVEIVRLVDELAALREGFVHDEPTAQAHALQRVLYGLHAIITLHLAKEEEVYLPVLDERLDAFHAADMFRRMGEAAHAGAVA